MCGIVGIISDRRRGDLSLLLARMNDSIVHRGPDDEGTWIDGAVAIAMRRLSIIDLSGGHQPMMTQDGVVIVFNGEIYNYRELREQLIRRGYVFKTRSDTEVILNLYHADGKAGLERLHGMFAICIVDRRADQMLLMRDHAGMKPLYVATMHGEILFASELKAIVKALDRKPEVNTQAIYDFLTLRYVPQPETIWNGIVKLLPAHRLVIDLRTRTQTLERWWQPDFTPQPAEPGRDYAAEFEKLFLEAVESHLVTSDVPVGAFLSGGLDSSAIVAAAAELGHRDIHTFSISGEDAGSLDELPDARLISAHVGTRHHEIVMTKRDFDELTDHCLFHMDEPYADPTCIAMFMLARLARQYVKVGLSGEGGDELLLGYTKAAHFAEIERVKRRFGWWPAWLLRAVANFAGGRRAEILHAVAEYGPHGFIRANAVMTQVFSEEQKARLWRGEPRRSSRETNQREFTLPQSSDPFGQSQQAQIQSWLVEDLLMKGDKMTMAASLEGRVPFLHKPMMEWCMRSPLSVRIGDVAAGEALRPKAVLRDFLDRRIPVDILSRPKRGFPIPYERWARDDARSGRPIVGASRYLTEVIDIAKIGDAVGGGEITGAQMWSLRALDRWMAINLG
jgi:asparagine synthase (glutamine-hydrolysing)